MGLEKGNFGVVEARERRSNVELPGILGFRQLDRLGYKASDPEDVVKFLNNPDGKCFLFPDNHMGPDLSCFVQDVVTKELIFLCLQSKLSKNLSAKASLRALASVDPDFFYNLKVCAEVCLCLLIL
jgi:hypothetical protein